MAKINFPIETLNSLKDKVCSLEKLAYKWNTSNKIFNGDLKQDEQQSSQKGMINMQTTDGRKINEINIKIFQFWPKWMLKKGIRAKRKILYKF